MSDIPRIRHNIIANFAGKSWINILGLLIVPFYIKYLGIESYGLIGIFMSMRSLISLLDMGLSTTLSKELSRLTSSPNSENEARNLLRTLEILFIFIGILIALLISILCDPIANNWINSSNLNPDLIKRCILAMGFSIAVSWPSSLYMGGMMGLQRQVQFNIIRSFFVGLQHFGALIILLFFSKSILIFFIWQSIISGLNTVVLHYFLWSILNKSYKGIKAKYKQSLLKKNFSFAAGVTGISFETIILTQMDKVILTKMLPLELFGYYIIAFNIADKLNNLVTPIVNALFPRFTQSISLNTIRPLIDLYHSASQLITLVVLPSALTIAFFSKEILYIWLSDIEVANNSYLLLSLLVVGTATSTLIALPYSIQLASGKTKLVFISNLVAISFLVPIMIFLTLKIQALGAALSWFLLNIFYLIFLVPKMHELLTKHGMKGWFLNNIIYPFFLSLIIVSTTKVIFLTINRSNLSILFIIIALSLSSLGSFFVLKNIKKGRMLNFYF